MLNLRLWSVALLLAACFGASSARGQIDPTKRELFQLGYYQPLEGHSPISAYAFYYYNQPSFLQTNLTLRLAVAPVYLDSELGIRNALGPNTDIGIGLAGGGFADSYYEIRQGKYYPDESFDGYGGGLSSSIYHLFNPNHLIPLNGVLRGGVNYSTYSDDNTASNFVLPKNRTTLNVRTGLRFGGMEPVLNPDLAMELSAWYEGQFRLNSGAYGFDNDRDVEAASHLFWGRALLAYTLPKSKQNFMVSITGGDSARVDRFSAYRIGGVLPLASEFPLTLPGYFYQELSASRFVLVNGIYRLPLDSHQRWELTAMGTAAEMDYAPGLEQPGSFNSGVGGGMTYRSRSQAWQVYAGYGYGFNAIRSNGRGAQSVGILIQLDLAHTRGSFYAPSGSTGQAGGLDRILQSFQ